ncbi:MAG: HAMP domain-containing protein [Anaerolineales bacterium]|nr:HAMP domain-containing protein [Anaerolineales bacterium]MCA9926909.1 HAMP domain-containing protein [Anaerolineales bacterium]
MIVVIVGVVIVLAAAWLFTNTFVPANVAGQLAGLAKVADAEAIAQVTNDVLDTFRRSVFTAVSIAALGAILAGLGTGLLLAREILRPLNEFARSSQRIARGHYQERVAVPTSDELAQVATNFNQMAASLEDVEQQRVKLIGNVSHELRTPLTGLNGYLEGLMDGVFPENEETYALMLQEVRRLRRLVDDLQSLSRAQAGQLSFHFETFDIVPLVRRVVAQLLPQAEAECLQVETATQFDELLVYADPDRTAQVLFNLIGNAIRYTPEDGCITVRITAVSRMAQISITDTGVGISVEALPYLFERFYRADPSRARQSGGSGIGLTIARHLVWAMGGDIIAASEGKDKGATFTFTLPIP